MTAALVDRIFSGWAPQHRFGTRAAPAPEVVVRPRQVHGAAVVSVADCRAAEPAPEADAIVSDEPEAWIGVVTADCVPVLLSAPGGRVVAAVHAGWRGLAAGVVEAGLRGLCERAGSAAGECAAAIGPHIGSCCYEVDEPVLAALAARHGAVVRAGAQATRPGHARIELGGIVRAALCAAGLPARAIGSDAAACTSCDAQLFHSHRRDGDRSGRLLHVVRATHPEA